MSSGTLVLKHEEISVEQELEKLLYVRKYINSAPNCYIQINHIGKIRSIKHTETF